MPTFQITNRYDPSQVLNSGNANSFLEFILALVSSRADLSRANLSRADLYGANLSRANLYGADLSRADLSRADLYGANLSRANLSRANLSGANLSRADLYGANLYGADLSVARNLENTYNLSEAIGYAPAVNKKEKVNTIKSWNMK